MGAPNLQATELLGRTPRRKARAVSLRKPLLVAIAGGSGSGKSWLAHQLEVALGRGVVRLCLDNFYRDRSHLPAGRRARLNFDHPRAIDWPSLERALEALLSGRPARVPLYDFKTHARERRLHLLRPQPLILLEGLWALRRPIRRRADLSIFLNCPSRLRLRRRMQRDQAARGRTPTSVERQFRESVEPMHVRFVQPQRELADVVFARNCGPRQVRHLVARIRQLLNR